MCLDDVDIVTKIRDRQVVIHFPQQRHLQCVEGPVIVSSETNLTQT